MKVLLHLIKVQKGIKENHLIFGGYIAGLDHNRLCKFDFDGTEICYTTSALTEVAKDELARRLTEEFGNSPYNYKVIKNLFGDGRIYELEM